ncbi:ABC transporter permease [Candidatus Pristimantibacillus sp. PTI5]|uniref:ABC transporter permease n=1 Tax=Candidatus Pristimantibacillus sp. PTI5 TaxID=3400422 RepID=UPI003B01F0F1
MRAYIEVARRSFHRKSSYKLEYYLGLFGSLLSIFISVAIWKAVYGSTASFAGITQEQAVTYAVIAMLMRIVLSMNEFLIDGKIKSGEIASDLIRPYHFLTYVFSMIIGEVGFNLWTKALPLIILSIFMFQLEVSHSWINLLFFLISAAFSYLLLYFFNLIFWLFAFWVHQTWSIVTIKNAAVLLLSGATIPYWFLPDWLAYIFEWLPFKYIYFTPVTIALGEAHQGDILRLFIEQIGWILLLAAAGLLLWRRAQNKLIIQGG